MTTTERTADVLHPDLAAGETVRAATQAQLDGGTMRLASRIGLSAATGAAPAITTADQDDLARLLVNGLVLAVTDRRVVLLDVTAVSARPKSLVASIDRAKVVDVTTGEKRVMLVKLPTIELVIAGDDPDDEHRALNFEIPKTARRDASAVVEALRA